MPRTMLRISEETKSKDLTGRNYIVTGANSGVGLETTRQLLKQGAHVTMAVRRIEAAEEVAKEFTNLKGTYDIMRIDLADLKTVREFVIEYKAKHDHLEGLDCNAGMANMLAEKTVTKDGNELTIQISYFGHFLLVESLLDLLKKSEDARIVILSSVVHAGRKNNRPQIYLNDLNADNRKYNNMQAYGEAKLANVLYAKELGERLEGTGVTAYSVHPGWARSNFGNGGSALMKVAMTIMRPLTRHLSDSCEDSAQTSLHCLISDEAPQYSGQYFSQQSNLYNDRECRPGGWPMQSPNPNANDMSMARKLVQKTYSIVGLD